MRLASLDIIAVALLQSDCPRSVGQLLLLVRLQWIDEDLLLAGVALMIRRQMVTPLSKTEELPIGRPIADFRKVDRIHKGFDQQWPISKCLQPVIGDLLGCKRKGVAGQIGDVNPGENQEAIVAQDQMQQLFSVLVIPADPTLAWRQSPGGRGGKQQTSESLLARLRDDKVAQMGTDWLAVAQIVVGLQIRLPLLAVRPRAAHRFAPDQIG